MTKYEENIYKLIPQAEQEADRTVNKNYYKNSETWMEKWNQRYHAEMNRLAREAGLR